jgi:hypothetical protein
MKIHSFIFLLVIFLLQACDSSYKGDYRQAAEISSDLSQREANPYLAYEHSISLESDHKKLQADYKKVVEACAADRTNNCALLKSELNSGNYASAYIQLRIAPAGVNPLLKLVSSLGDVSSQSTHIEDLSTAIADSEKRIAMLTSYQNQMLELQKKENIDIESALRIAQEIANIQSQLEDTAGAAQYLKTRTKMDIVNIRFSTQGNESSPISDAFSEFSDALFESVASVIIATAYLLPWGILIYLLFLIGRFLWRRRK